MNDFKPGDIVCGIANNGYSIANEKMKKAEVLKVLEYDVNSMLIKILSHEDKEEIGVTSYVENTSSKFKKYISKELHITTDGYKTYGILKENGKVIKRTVVRCHPEDTFDFKVGVNVVMDRLFEEEKKLYLIENGKKIGKLGKPVEQKDSWGNKLHVGDVVEYYAASPICNHALEPVGQAIVISNSELIVIQKDKDFNSIYPFILKSSYESMAKDTYYPNTNIKISSL